MAATVLIQRYNGACATGTTITGVGIKDGR